MEIATIKSHLSIESVLTHYGLSADRNGMLSCPLPRRQHSLNATLRHDRPLLLD
jgi:hypothetical protein